MICAEAAINVDWQFANNLQADHPDLSPFSALSMFLGSWSFNLATGKIAISDPRLDNVKRVMDTLKSGQRHNPSAAATYDACLVSCGSIFDFMIVVVSAAPRTIANIAEARINIDWQKQNNSDSIAAAKIWRSRSLATSDHDGLQYCRVSAVFNLMWGQQHNTHVMSLYRACFRENAVTLFSLL